MLSAGVFWKYAVDFYGRPGVTNTCLTLQDKLGLNVNLLLLLCWCEQNNKQLSGEQIDSLIRCVERWHRDYTQPLRQIRRKLALDDGASVDAKTAIFDAEMALEKVEQRLLLTTFNQWPNIDAKNGQNLQRYIGRVDSGAVLTYARYIVQLRASFTS